jgi:hypothetical protein
MGAINVGISSCLYFLITVFTMDYSVWSPKGYLSSCWKSWVFYPKMVGISF